MELYTGGTEDLSIVFNSTSSNNVNWSLTLPGQISILNYIISSLSKAAVLKETSISSGTMEAVLKMLDGSLQLPQIVTGRENIRNQLHCTVNRRPILPSHLLVRENEGSWYLSIYLLKTSILKSLVTLAILEALTGAVNSLSAQFFALNQSHLFLTNEKNFSSQNFFCQSTVGKKPGLKVEV